MLHSNRNQPEDAPENASILNPGNAGRQLGLSVEAGDSGDGHTLQLTAQPCIPEGGYAVLNPRTIITRPNGQEETTSLLLNNYSWTRYASA